MSTGDTCLMLTPVYSHAGRGDFRDVYEPAEDSFLLIDALEKDAELLQQMGSDAFPPPSPDHFNVRRLCFPEV